MPKIRYRQNSKKLSNTNVSQLIESIKLAFEKETPLNRLVTVNLEEVSVECPKELLRSILDNYRKFCSRRSFEPAYVWCLENNKGNNLHVHLLIHIPPSDSPRFIDQFKRKMKFSWLDNMKQKVDKKQDWFNCKSIKYGPLHEKKLLNHSLQDFEEGVQSELLETHQVAERVNFDFSHPISGYFEFQNVVNILGYLTKGIRPYSQGTIRGRRIGRSHNLIGSI